MSETLALASGMAPRTDAPRRARFDPFTAVAVAVGSDPDPHPVASEPPGSSDLANRLLRPLAISPTGRYYPHRNGSRRPTATPL